MSNWNCFFNDPYCNDVDLCADCRELELEPDPDSVPCELCTPDSPCAHHDPPAELPVSDYPTIMSTQLDDDDFGPF